MSYNQLEINNLIWYFCDYTNVLIVHYFLDSITYFFNKNVWKCNF